MQQKNVNQWLLAAVLCAPGVASAMGGEGMAEAVLCIILLAAFFMAGIMAVLSLLLGRFIFRRSRAALWVGLGIAALAPVGLFVHFGISFAALRPELQFALALLLSPILLAAMLAVAVVVILLPVRAQEAP